MNISRKALKGTIWLSGANYFFFFVTFGTDLVLARLLLPEDFGTVALAMSILNILAGLSTLGFGTMVVQYQASDKIQEQKFFGTVYTLQILTGCIIAGSSIIIALLLRHFYDSTVLTVFITLAIGRGIQYFIAMPGLLMNKEMMFRQVAILNFSSLGGAALLSILMAWYGWGYWSLVGRYLSKTLFVGLLSWYIVRWRPALAWDAPSLKYIWRFARNLWLSRNLEVTLMNIDDMAVGVWTSATDLGFYSRAYKLSKLFIEYIAPAIARTTLPTYSTLQNDIKAVTNIFNITIRFLARMSALFYLEIGLLAPLIVLILYGEQWMPMVSLFRIMLVYAFLQPLLNQFNTLFVALGHPHLVSKQRLLQTIFFVPAVCLSTVLWGANGAAQVVNITALIGILAAIKNIKNFVPYSIINTILPSLFSIMLTLTCILSLQYLWQFGNQWLSLIVYAPLIALVFVCGLLLVEGKMLISDLGRVYQGLKKA